MQMPKERRQFSRVSIQVEGELAVDDAMTIRGVSRDVSLNGLFMLCDTSLPVGANCRVTLFLGDREAHTRVEAHGRVVRREDAGVGLTFTEIMGLDSFEHLRNLVLYNAQDEGARVEEEFARHCGIKAYS